MYDTVVGRVKGFSIKLIGDDRDAVVGFVANDAAVAVFEGDLAALTVESVAVAITSWLADGCDLMVILQPAVLDVVWDVAPDQIISPSAPSGAFGPVHSGVQTFDGCHPDFVFGEGRIDGDDVGFWVADWRGVWSEVAGEKGGSGESAERGEERASIRGVEGVHKSNWDSIR